MSIGWDYVSELPTGLLFTPPPDGIWIWSHGGMILTGETEEIGEKPVPVPPFHHKPHMDWDGRERLSFVVRGRRLTAWAMHDQIWC
jgi:hypothetical protein